LSELVNAAAMPEHVDTEKLVEEIDRYLATVDFYRTLGCQPSWRREAPHGLDPDAWRSQRSRTRIRTDIGQHSA